MTRIGRMNADFRAPEAQLFLATNDTNFHKSSHKLRLFLIRLNEVWALICENLCNLWLIPFRRRRKIRVNPLNPRHPRSH